MTGFHDPDAEPAVPWFKSRTFLIVAVVAVILAITVITDLPAPASRASNIDAANTVITTINTDLAPCTFAVTEAISYEAVVSKGQASYTQRAQAPQLLNDDLIACSLVNSSVFDLSDSDVPGSATGKQLAAMLSTSEVWAVRDAHDTIDEILTLRTDPNSAAALTALRTDLSLMAGDRATAVGLRQTAATVLSAQLDKLQLPITPSGAALLGPT